MVKLDSKMAKLLSDMSHCYKELNSIYHLLTSDMIDDYVLLMIQTAILSSVSNGCDRLITHSSNVNYIVALKLRAAGYKVKSSKDKTTISW